MSLLRSSFTTSRVLSRRTYNYRFAAPVITSKRTMASKQQTITEAVREDHSELYEYYQKITAKDADDDTRKKYQNIFVWELARHSAGEELVVYPAMEKHLGEKGKELADKDRKQHKEIKQLLYDWESMSPSDPTFLSKLEAIWSVLSPHNDEEETDDLPPLEAAIGSQAESRKLGKSFTRTKLFVPTRTHPSMPQKPLFETALSLLIAPVDKLTDAFRSFPEED